MARKPTNLTGKTFGELTVIASKGPDHSGAYVWRCRCTCGKEASIRGHRLTSGIVTKCDKNHAERMRILTAPAPNEKHWSELTQILQLCKEIDSRSRITYMAVHKMQQEVETLNKNLVTTMEALVDLFPEPAKLADAERIVRDFLITKHKFDAR